jgi:hypothetical protein
MFCFQRISCGRTLARGYSEYHQSERYVPLIYQAGRRVNNTYDKRLIALSIEWYTRLGLLILGKELKRQIAKNKGIFKIIYECIIGLDLDLLQF